MFMARNMFLVSPPLSRCPHHTHVISLSRHSTNVNDYYCVTQYLAQGQTLKTTCQMNEWRIKLIILFKKIECLLYLEPPEVSVPSSSCALVR